jgi:hypothetical protein
MKRGSGWKNSWYVRPASKKAPKRRLSSTPRGQKKQQAWGYLVAGSLREVSGRVFCALGILEIVNATEFPDFHIFLNYLEK